MKKVIDKNYLKKSSITRENILIAAFSISIFIAITVPMLAAIFKYAVLPIIMIALYKTEEFEYLLFPLCFLDNPLGTYVGGRLTLLWLFLAAIIMKQLLSKRNIRIKKYRLFPLILLFSYFIFASLDYGLFFSLKMIMIIFFFYQISEKIQDNPQQLNKLYFVIITSSLVSALGLALNLLGEGGEIRTEGIGFEDPNYSAFICLIGFCAAIYYKCNSKFEKFLFLMFDFIFVFAIFRSGSRAGLIILVMIILLYILMAKGISKKFKRASLISIFSIAAIYTILLVLDLSFFEGLIARWQYTLEMFQAGNWSGTTANRNDIFSAYLSYYLSQNVLKILFGGNIIASSSLLYQVGGGVTHNVYLDYLMAFGAVGFVIMMFFGLKRTWQYYKKYVVTGELAYAAAVEIKLMTMAFGLTLAFAQVNLWWVIFLL